MALQFRMPRKGTPMHRGIIKGRPLRISGSFGISLSEITDVKKNLSIFAEYLDEKAVLIMAWIMIDLLNRSQGIVPHDTGELKESGTAVVQFGGYRLPVAKGTADENSLATIDLSRISGRLNKTIKFITGDVFYYRFNEQGQDIALWAHEDLNPYGGQSPKVRKPGRSPKYLEIPYSQQKNKYKDWIRDAFARDDIINDMKKMRKLRKVAKGRYEVDLVTLNKYSVGAGVGLPTRK